MKSVVVVVRNNLGLAWNVVALPAAQKQTNQIVTVTAVLGRFQRIAQYFYRLPPVRQRFDKARPYSRKVIGPGAGAARHL